MKELDDILSAYEDAERNGTSCLLATLVKVDGSSYRRAGARILLASTGERTGGVSGGCLEAEIAKKAWWLTEGGPALQRYNTAGDGDSGIPFGLGCNGVLHVLMQRIDAATKQLLTHLRKLRNDRIPAALATVISGSSRGVQRIYPDADPAADHHDLLTREIVDEALRRVATRARSEYLLIEDTEIFVEALAPSQRLIVFGAGDDARPLVQLARVLGWHVVVADGRSHLANRTRFPEANAVFTAPAPELPSLCAVQHDDAVVLMTHSYPQDLALLDQLLDRPVRYLGLLGPRQRTERLLEAIGRLNAPEIKQLHAPIGLKIGAHTPETIALAIIAEIQAVNSEANPEFLLRGEQVRELEALA